MAKQRPVKVTMIWTAQFETVMDVVVDAGETLAEAIVCASSEVDIPESDSSKYRDQTFLLLKAKNTETGYELVS